MQKIVINTTYGGFDLSDIGYKYYADLAGIILDPNFSVDSISRDDINLVQTVEHLGEKASSYFSRLKVVEIPDNIFWSIKEYDGREWVAEKHLTWE